ncbi:hypothetical protein TCAL_12023, partial [Tigriopus californicus]
MNPPEPPLSFKLHPVWNGDPVSFGEDITYECESDFIDGVLDDQGDPLFSKLFFENERSQNVINVTCLEGGLFDIPNIWPKCVKTIYCGAPPAKRPEMRLHWLGDGSYQSKIVFDCGLFSDFITDVEPRSTYSEQSMTCAWDSSWSPRHLDPCQPHSCPIVPVPPKASRLKYAPNHKDGSQVAQIMDSEFMAYEPNPKVVPVPNEFCQHESQIFLLIGTIPWYNSSLDEVPRLEFETVNNGLSLVIEFMIHKNYLFRWAT